MSALVNLLDSADYMVSLKAMDALLVVCALPDGEAAANAAEGTDLAEVVGGRLAALYDAIPQEVDAAMVEEVRVNWVEAHHLLQQGQQQQQQQQQQHSASLPEFEGKQELVGFYSTGI